MFFLRCAFWLSIVYSSMSFATTGSNLHFGRPTAEKPVARTGDVIDHALSGASELCHRHAAQCLTGAARLTSLLAAAEAANPMSADGGRSAPTHAASAQRRRVRDAKLARAS